VCTLRKSRTTRCGIDLIQAHAHVVSTFVDKANSMKFVSIMHAVAALIPPSTSHIYLDYIFYAYKVHIHRWWSSDLMMGANLQ